jgi:hypothetical protein
VERGGDPRRCSSRSFAAAPSLIKRLLPSIFDAFDLLITVVGQPTASDRRVGAVRLTEFWRRMEERFGATYAASVAVDYRLPELGSTINEALTSGVEAKEVWRAVCAEFEMPPQLR